MNEWNECSEVKTKPMDGLNVCMKEMKLMKERNEWMKEWMNE